MPRANTGATTACPHGSDSFEAGSDQVELDSEGFRRSHQITPPASPKKENPTSQTHSLPWTKRPGINQINTVLHAARHPPRSIGCQASTRLVGRPIKVSLRSIYMATGARPVNPDSTARRKR